MPPADPPAIQHRARLERRRLLRSSFVVIVVSGRVCVQISGAGRNRGWATRTVCADDAQAGVVFQEMLDDHLLSGYRRLPWDDALWAELPTGLLDPDLRGQPDVSGSPGQTSSGR